MSGHKTFENLPKEIGTDPAWRARVELYKKAMDIAMALTDLRESRGVTQHDLAAQLGVSQANISRIERQDDLYLSTLAHYVTALGGHLKVEAEFPDHSITIVGADSSAEELSEVETA